MRKTAVLPAFLVLILFAGLGATQPTIGITDLDRLISLHRPPRLAENDRKSLDRFERQIAVVDGAEPVTFSISGFVFYGCAKCHKADDLVESAAKRMRYVTQTLLQENPAIKKIPLRQYIIQTYADNLLHEQQFAHATFDTIRVFPRTILVDSKVYNFATHLHETLHLTQTFLDHVNELEAYGLNARSDPRFLILNYPYFADVVSGFFMPDFERVLKAWFARETKEHLSVPREVQWFMQPFDKLAGLEDTIIRMKPLFAEVGRLNRNHPVEIAYLSDRTGVSSLALELAAVKQLPLQPLAVEDDFCAQAFKVLDFQMAKTDNTRLGYVIDRKKEALMTLQHQLKVADPAERLQIYFHYLKQRFILPNGEINLAPGDKEDFLQYAQAKIERVRNMLQYEGITPIEREAGRQWEDNIKKELSAYTTESPK